MVNKKYEVVVTLKNKTVILTPDKIGWEYPQTDGEGSGATDENVMIREVLPERDKLTLYFEGRKSESAVRDILSVRKADECSVNFYDLRSGERLTKRMYPVSDEFIADLLDEEDKLYIQPFNLRLIQTVPN